ncbi:MAG: tRNA threonylcarbamoyladenosine biosynthesis protein RimN [Cobetia sp.]|jgi:L-threonylcarbamoyladenylate synthase|uniref:L-threonylcarbamoyladenylate synthase n=1 Tax=Cobetia TaxID=204286 RepID=UPI000C605344|nr:MULTISPECIES: Sua5/YciO/YrdC/YwlC family protein [Cobetia]MBR9755800.1 tRNA threonylcarbamoyladenosine biosynthesis protein RimN [Gammaproteobacteria bacterium]NVN57023.1 tRNA threonylcarbamoyladenosine biosynthesis protein RimN [bacterium Scap17]MBF09938.1 tRNA threonylcarbamoyladenosine biosynthesis protein RimN [Cobetia sp.]MBK08613.1 tRNA threonylcarbamoyladenosine biosynthesis protein RimN [Cobetia sp.]MBR9797397.1 tRNA threonylcarbamoyladenosine biosynthesis protein RimN [Gammaproteob|tara:strand:+ start:29525 stop:30106 length:582 start_codon:yes stop_codon:yes gene_type:complete
MNVSDVSLDQRALDGAAACLRNGGIVAYPTEAVWGLGCDPDDGEALARLIKLKSRDAAKGLILIAGDIAQLEPWLAGVTVEQREQLLASWPGPYTWLVPDNGRAHPLLRGEHVSLAVRVTDHPLVQALCAAFGGPLVSTSANRAGESPAMTADEVRDAFGDALVNDVILEGPLGGNPRPSTIRDLATGKVLRA